MTLDVVFVCQQGDLEVMACLLAASLRRSCGDRVHLHVIQPIPESAYGEPSAEARAMLDALGARWYRFTNPVSDDYKIFNKLNAFRVDPQGDRILFLDNDVLVRRPLLPALAPYFRRPFAAASGGTQKFSSRAEHWQPVYGLFGLQVPELRWPSAATHEWGPPYFNAGVILVDPSLQFSDVWADTCLRIHQEIGLEKPGTVQVGLPVAVYRRNAQFSVLDRRFNLGVGPDFTRVTPAWTSSDIHIAHYFKPKNLCIHPGLASEAADLVWSFRLQEILALTPRWKGLLKIVEGSKTTSAGRQAAERPADEDDGVAGSRPAIQTAGERRGGARREVRPRRVAFVTGIPRSGAGLLGSHLSGAAAVAYPDLPNRQNGSSHPDLEALCAGLERWVGSGRLEGLEALHASVAGGVASGPVREGSPLLVTVNAAVYLSSLDRLLDRFPEAPIFLTVRDPIATIASWRSSCHPGRSDDGEWLSQVVAANDGQQRLLAALRGAADRTSRLAGLWNYFASLASVTHPNVHVVRFESLVAEPVATMRSIGHALQVGDGLVRQLGPAGARQERAQVLADKELECIRAACSDRAGLFGYNVYQEPSGRT